MIKVNIGKVLLSIILTLFFLLSCDQKPKNPVAEYGDALIDTYKRGQNAGEIANLDAVKSVVKAYHASNDRYPQSLAEIKNLIGADRLYV